jgi:hypothetical protein
MFFESLASKGQREMASKKDAASYRAARIIEHGASQAFAQTRTINVSNKDVSWESLRILKDDISTSVRTLRDIRDRTAAELSGFYILDMRSFSGVTERLAKNGERLTVFLDSEGSNLQKARTINGIIDSMKDARSELIQKQHETAQLKIEKSTLLVSIEKLTQKAEELGKDPEVNQVLTIEKELRKESRSFRSETLAHLQRPIRRLREISERGDFPIDPEQRLAMAEYLQSPYKSFLSPSTGKFIRPILENMKQALDTGKMEFKQRKAIRISNHLKQLLSTTQLMDKQERGVALVKQRRQLLSNPTVKSMYLERKNILEQITNSKNQLKHLEERMSIANETVQTANQRLVQLTSLAEAKTREYLRKEIQFDRMLNPVSA